MFALYYYSLWHETSGWNHEIHDARGIGAVDVGIPRTARLFNILWSDPIEDGAHADPNTFGLSAVALLGWCCCIVYLFEPLKLWKNEVDSMLIQVIQVILDPFRMSGEISDKIWQDWCRSRKLASASWSPSCQMARYWGGWKLQSHETSYLTTPPSPSPAGWFTSTLADGTPSACGHRQQIQHHPHPELPASLCHASLTPPWASSCARGSNSQVFIRLQEEVSLRNSQGGPSCTARSAAFLHTFQRVWSVWKPKTT